MALVYMDRPHWLQQERTIWTAAQHTSTAMPAHPKEKELSARWTPCNSLRLTYCEEFLRKPTVLRNKNNTKETDLRNCRWLRENAVFHCDIPWTEESPRAEQEESQGLEEHN